MLPSDPVSVIWVAKADVMVKVDDAPTAIEEGFAEMSTTAGPDELLV